MAYLNEGMKKFHSNNDRNVGVCLASLAFFPLYAGPALRFQRYAPGLRDRGICMRVFTQAVTDDLIQRDGSVAEGNGSWDGHNGYPAYETVDGISIQRVSLPPGWRREPAYFRRLAHYCRQQRSAIDVVQLLNVDLLAAPWLCQLRRQGIGLVYTHTLLGDLSVKRWKRLLQRAHRRLPLHLVDKVVVSSTAMRDRLQEMEVTTPVVVIPNGVDLQRFSPLSSEHEKAVRRRELGLDPGWDIILAIGPIIPRKGVDVLLEAFVSLCSDFPQAHLVLVGPRHDLARESLASFRRQLEEIVVSAGVQERVTFTGAVGNVEDYLKVADILVFPSRREGMPNVVPEAMASELPVVMTPFIGLPVEFGRPGVHYLLSDWAPARLAGAIRWLIADEGLRRQFGEAARRWVTETMGVEQSLDAYATLYRHLQMERQT